MLINLRGVFVSAIALAACGGTAFGPPMAPTTNQQQAVTQVTGSVDQLSSLNANPVNALTLFVYMGGVGGSAVIQTAKHAHVTADELIPQNSTCITGDGDAGWTYTDCTVGDYSLSGTAQKSAETTTINLNAASTQSSIKINVTFSGSITDSGSHLAGDLVYAYKADMGDGPQSDRANITTTVRYNIDYTIDPTCLAAGSVEIDLGGAMTGAAKFVWTACEQYQVQNG